MVTLKLKNVRRGVDLAVENTDLANHTPLDVFKMIVERDATQKPPKGSIWLMKLPAGAQELIEIDHFATFTENHLDERVIYDLIECPCPLTEGK